MHPATILWACMAVTFGTGLAVLLIWRGDRRAWELAVSSAALLAQSAGSAVIAGQQVIPAFWRILLANSLLLASFSLMWCAVRLLVGRRPHPAVLLPVAIWGLACLQPGFLQAWTTRVALFAALGILLNLACIRELWRRPARLQSGPVAMVLFGLHALTLLGNAVALAVTGGGTVIGRFGEVIAWLPPAFTMLAMLALWPTLALVLLAMVKERADLALRESEGRFRQIAEALEEGLAILEPERQCVVYASPGFRRLLPPLPGRLPFPAGDLPLLLHPADQARLREVLAQPACVPGSVDYRVRHADGAERHIRQRCFPMPGEAPRRVLLVLSDVTEEREAAERQALLAGEVDHRAKNVLMVVLSILRLTPFDGPAAYARAVEGRVAALARSHQLLARGRWLGGDLRALLDEELSPYAGGGAEAVRRCGLDGPSLLLRPEAVQPLGMVVHELATNSAKHGALSAPGGTVRVSWTLAEGTAEAAGRLELDWVEAGGPPVAGTPGRSGFGSRVIRRSAERHLGGTLALDWAPGGLRCRLSIPAARIIAPGRGGAPVAAGGAGSPPGPGRGQEARPSLQAAG